MNRVVLSLAIVLFCLCGWAQNSVIDSLTTLSKTNAEDTVKLKVTAELARQYLIISEYDRADSLSNEVLIQTELALSATGLSDVYRNALLKIRSRAYNTLGVAGMYRGDHDQALQNHLKALEIREKMNDEQGVSASFNNIGNVYLQKNELSKGMQWYHKSVAIANRINDKYLLSMGYNNIGLIYQDLNVFDTAMIYLLKALKIREELGNKQHIAASYNNIALVSFTQNNYPVAEEYYLKSLEVMKETGDKMSLSVAYNNLGNLYLKQGKTALAKKTQLLSLELGLQSGSKPALLYSYTSLAQCDSALGNFKGAYEYHKLYAATSDSIFNEESERLGQEMQAKYDTEKKQHEIELLTASNALNESKNRTQQIVISAIVAGLLILIAFAFILFNRLRITREQKSVIEAQKAQVDQKNKHITDSINYAKRIQDAILPSATDLQRGLPEHFLFYQPREIVSGDFYWLGKRNADSALLVVADCTGHGVPGAFMSMIGNTLLNKIVNEQKISQPAEILDQLHAGIVNALHQQERTQDDGMDVSVCLLEPGRVTFAGANHSLYIVSGGELQEIKGDHYSIGSQFGKQDASFTQKSILTNHDTCFYLSTDGYADQRGGDKGKKLTVKAFKTLLTSLAPHRADEQEQLLRAHFSAWKGLYGQMDDVLVMGIKIL